jgi:hypothetical protein
LVVTAQEELIRLPDDSKAKLEAAALLDEPFFVPLLIDLGFSADGLDPLFDAGILREVFSDQSVFANSELRTGLLTQENQNDETRAAIRGVLAETAWYHSDLTSAVALMREAASVRFQSLLPRPRSAPRSCPDSNALASRSLARWLSATDLRY